MPGFWCPHCYQVQAEGRVVQPGPPNSVGECHLCETLVCSKCRPAHRCQKPPQLMWAREKGGPEILLPKLIWLVEALGEDSSDTDSTCTP
jgi:hypothetical protein